MERDFSKFREGLVRKQFLGSLLKEKRFILLPEVTKLKRGS
jgi:hypothetical protein